MDEGGAGLGAEGGVLGDDDGLGLLVSSTGHDTGGEGGHSSEERETHLDGGRRGRRLSRSRYVNRVVKSDESKECTR